MLNECLNKFFFIKEFFFFIVWIIDLYIINFFICRNDDKIDIVRWDEDPAIYIANALSPAKVVSVSVWDEDRRAHV